VAPSLLINIEVQHTAFLLAKPAPPNVALGSGRSTMFNKKAVSPDSNLKVRRFNSASAAKLSPADFHAQRSAILGEVPICLTTD
jgi:hypothetical protein